MSSSIILLKATPILLLFLLSNLGNFSLLSEELILLFFFFSFFPLISSTYNVNHVYTRHRIRSDHSDKHIDFWFNIVKQYFNSINGFSSFVVICFPVSAKTKDVTELQIGVKVGFAFLFIAFICYLFRVMDYFPMFSKLRMIILKGYAIAQNLRAFFQVALGF